MEEILQKFITNNSNFIQAILPTIISSITALLVAKYTYNKNRPLDKLEYAYNEVYYPIYKFVKDKNNYKNVYVTKNALKIYFDSYEKYLDLSTIKAFNELYNYKTKAEEKSAYNKFFDNICNMNIYLRKRLGYLEPNIFQMFRYSSAKNQVNFLTILVFMIAYISICLGSVFTKLIQEFVLITMIFIFLGIILLLIRFIMFLIYKFK